MSSCVLGSPPPGEVIPFLSADLATSTDASEVGRRVCAGARGGDRGGRHRLPWQSHPTGFYATAEPLTFGVSGQRSFALNTSQCSGSAPRLRRRPSRSARRRRPCSSRTPARAVETGSMCHARFVVPSPHIVACPAVLGVACRPPSPSVPRAASICSSLSLPDGRFAEDVAARAGFTGGGFFRFGMGSRLGVQAEACSRRSE